MRLKGQEPGGVSGGDIPGTGDRRMGPLLVALAAALILASCMTPRRGYIGDTGVWERRIAAGKLPVDSLLRSTSTLRAEWVAEARQWGAHFPAGTAGVFTPRAINGIFANLQRQIHGDSLLQAAVRVEKDPRAVASLLESAGHYDRLYRPNPRLRRMINRGNQAYGIPRGILDKTHRYLLSPRVRKPVAASLPADLPGQASYSELFHYTFWRRGDRANEAGYDLVNWFSALFGNSVGTLNPEICRPREQQLLKAYLQPLDIILVKSPTHITDKFIPGFFGHAAIYTGNPEELRAMGVWELPEVARHQARITAGGAFAEALRSGVRLSTPVEFADGDYFLVLRISGLTEAEKQVALARTFRYLHQKYDFNFDIQSPDRLYCTELIFLAFEMIRWKSHHLWDRETISPDEIVETALDGQRLLPVVLIGPQSEEISPSQERIRGLLEE